MGAYVLTHLADAVLLRELKSVIAHERTATAVVLAHIAEVDARRLYLPAACSSMHEYCLRELHLSEGAAAKRLGAARAAREFPAIFAAVAEGRLHLSGVGLLKPRLTRANAEELIAAAAHKTNAEIELLLAHRFPRPDVPTTVSAELSVRTVDASNPGAEPSAPGTVEAHAPRPRVTPLAPERYALQLTIEKGTHDKLRHAQALLSHQLPSGDIAQVLDRALDALIVRLEKRKFAATTQPRLRRAGSGADKRYVPAEVKRAVRERDGDRCTFVSESGRRCEARARLEFDHVVEVARGGQATVSGIRLRCRAHNQYGAECTFGAGFMAEKRQEAKRAAAARHAEAEARHAEAEARARAAAARERTAEARARVAEVRASAAEQCAKAAAERNKAAAARAEAEAIEQDPDRSVVPWLRQLGFRADEARRAAELCEKIPDASLEERVKVALTYFHPRGSHGLAQNAPGTTA